MQYFKAIHSIISKGHKITDQVNKALKSDGYTEPQYNVLRILTESSPAKISVEEIQKQMVQRNSNVTRLLDKLEEKKCIKRTTNPQNGRKVDVSMTATGVKKLKSLDKKVLKLHEPMMKTLTQKELKTLNDLITKLGDNDV